jgi:hypothetical protein
MGSDRPIRESPVERPRTRRIRDLNPGSVSIKTEDMLRSGEACLWFNPTSQMLVNRSLQKAVRKSASSVGRVADEQNTFIERQSLGQPIPIETEERPPQSRLKPKSTLGKLAWA